MENTEQNSDIKSILKNLMTSPYSQTENIVLTEQNLKNLYQENPQNIEILIGLLFCNVMFGKRGLALELSQKIWQLGGNLSPFFELVYSDCLINLGELEKAEILITPRLKKLSDNLDYFYMVFVKYALASGNLFLLTQIGEYPGNDVEKTLFDFAKKHAFNESSIQYKSLIKIVMNTIKNDLCSLEYVMYPDVVEIILYTSKTEEENNAIQDKIETNLEEIFSQTAFEFDDFSIKLENISNHTAWLEV